MPSTQYSPNIETKYHETCIADGPPARSGQLTPDIKATGVEPTCPQSTIYFDGSCPLCRAEIGYYRRTDQAGALCFIDVSEPAGVMPEGLTQNRAMARFHVRASDGRVVSGAAAFVEVWTRLPGWRWAARAAALPGCLAALEFGYRMFLPIRPLLSRLFGTALRLKPVRGGAGRG